MFSSFSAQFLTGRTVAIVVVDTVSSPFTTTVVFQSVFLSRTLNIFYLSVYPSWDNQFCAVLCFSYLCSLPLFFLQQLMSTSYCSLLLCLCLTSKQSRCWTLVVSQLYPFHFFKNNNNNNLYIYFMKIPIITYLFFQPDDWVIFLVIYTVFLLKLWELVQLSS